MKSRLFLIVLVVTLTVTGFVGRAEADGNGNESSEKYSHHTKEEFGLSGRTFAIKGKYLYVNDLLIPPDELKAGDTFLNCYTFLEDVVEDTLDSGIWLDPQFFAPGTWVQISKGRFAKYTAQALFSPDGGPGILLAQNGMAGPGNHKRAAWLKAHSTISFPTFGLVVATVRSTGYEVENDQVEECLPPETETETTGS